MSNYAAISKAEKIPFKRNKKFDLTFTDIGYIIVNEEVIIWDLPTGYFWEFWR